MQLSAQQRARLDLGRRAFDLSRLGFLYSDQISDTSIEGRRRIVDKLTTAARRLNQWADMPLGERPCAYCRAYHANLLRILRREAVDLAALEQREVA